jgi:hypothetical protein
LRARMLQNFALSALSAVNALAAAGEHEVG